MPIEALKYYLDHGLYLLLNIHTQNKTIGFGIQSIVRK